MDGSTEEWIDGPMVGLMKRGMYVWINKTGNKTGIL